MDTCETCNGTGKSPADRTQELPEKPEQSGWRSIESAPHHEYVLLVAESYDGAFAAWRGTNNKWHVYPDGRAVWSEPTHWMPLPTPPKQEGE